MANWVLKGLSTGVVTTEYPAKMEKDLETRSLGPAVTGEKCISNCSNCKDVCYTGAIAKDTLEEDTPVIDYSKCLFCLRCIEVCPGKVISQVTHNELTKLNDAHILNLNRTRTLFGRSLHIRHIDAGACEACLSEIGALNNPYYDISRLGFFFTSSPRHADVLMVSGPVTGNMEDALMKTYQAIPDPKLVIAVGGCACSRCITGENYACPNQLDSLIPVDVSIPGCPPSPLELMHGLLTAVGRRPDFTHKSNREVL
jgi:Ni,Fe-hydrogenase III small subunit/Pyruvate/2-oxoacid:ferredoxin oxidoreductase delta subunit